MKPQPAAHDAFEPPLELVVSASTSNLGPGFDLLGLALGLELRVRVNAFGAGRDHVYETLTGEARGWPQDSSNLLVRAIRRVHPLGRGLVLSVHSEIPVERGLGSSGAAVAAGLLIGRALAGEELSLHSLAARGSELERHPDNVVASLFGGCTLAVPTGSGAISVVQHTLHPSLGVALAWPRTPLGTREARAALPRSVPFADAVENPRRLALLLEGLRTADPELLALGGHDRLHVPYRLPLISGAAEALAAAREAGASLATISGSGSALVALASTVACPAIASAMAEQLGPEATGRTTTPSLEAPRVLRVQR